METDEIKGLEIAVTQVEAGLRRRFEFPDAEIESVAAAMALLSAMVAQCRAILLLAKSQVAQAGSSNLRTVFEAWTDLRYLLSVGDRNENGRRFRVYAMIELREYNRGMATPEDDHEADIAQIEKEIAPYRATHPELVATIEKEHASRSMLWSGKTRSAMLRTLNDQIVAKLPSKEQKGPTLLQAFKLLSWDSHNTMTGVLDVWIEPDEKGETRVVVGRRQTLEESAAFNATIADQLLRDAWVHFTRTFAFHA